MKTDNVIPIKSTIEIGSITLNRVKEALNAWRAAKKNRSEKIPTALWSQIITLLKSHTESEVRSVLALTPVQIERVKQLLKELNAVKEPRIGGDSTSIDFCEAQRVLDAAVIPFHDTQTESNISEEE